jgi:hypothetical protein
MIVEPSGVSSPHRSLRLDTERVHSADVVKSCQLQENPDGIGFHHGHVDAEHSQTPRNLSLPRLEFHVVRMPTAEAVHVDENHQVGGQARVCEELDDSCTVSSACGAPSSTNWR